jgi:hypothetical protein
LRSKPRRWTWHSDDSNSYIVSYANGAGDTYINDVGLGKETFFTGPVRFRVKDNAI